ncbi:hypothetical protein FCOIX_5557 [Fusarium coicis]|nr:hypothetical protein FCOIX_5557 [Fusarium coicis]
MAAPQRPLSTLCKKCDEKALKSFLHDSVGDLVKVIIEELKQKGEVRRRFQIGDGVIFEKHLHALTTPKRRCGGSHQREDVINSTAEAGPLKRPQTSATGQICVYRSGNTASSRRNMLFISEFKSPHKLCSQYLRTGLRTTDIHEEMAKPGRL